MAIRWLREHWRRLSAQGLFVASFALVIAIGTAGFLVLPGLHTGARLSAVDALFTATSAVCVTGLIVVDTATHFTFWGQLWILFLIQIGGLGLMSWAAVIIGIMGRRLSLRTEMIAAPSLEERHGRDLVKLALSIIGLTLATEAFFAAVLWLQWIPDYGVATAAWHAVFQSVSAFCNAGFSTFSDSLVSVADRPGIVLTISVLIIVGGFGYPSTLELARWFRERSAGKRRRLSAHTHAAVLVTLALLAGGSAVFIALEWNGVLAEMSVANKVVNAWFMSTTPRTAGFNTVPYEQLGNDAAYFTILLMVIGGSPGSTAGGIKTTTMAILIAMAWSRIRGRRFVELHDRTVPDATVERTVSLALIYFLLVTAANFALSFTETGNDIVQSRQAFLPLMFETASAAGTVGLSMGVTASLTTLGKIVIILTMFMGRVGPLALFAAISIRGGAAPTGYRPAREDVIVG